jgi:hypothetical protein
MADGIWFTLGSDNRRKLNLARLIKFSKDEESLINSRLGFQGGLGRIQFVGLVYLVS